jgi:hypothetical protein
MRIILCLLIALLTLSASEEIPTKEEVSKLYVATFNRAPDSQGLDYWVNDSSLNLNQIAQSISKYYYNKRICPSCI